MRLVYANHFQSLIARAWAGGLRGRQVLDRLLPKLSSLLSPGGFLYLIAIEENDPNEICENLVSTGFRSAQIFTRRRAQNEQLMVIKAVR
jgi:release factor glutamine methyltransferase